MVSDDQLFRSVRSVYIALAAYVNKVGKEIGMEKAGRIRISNTEQGTPNVEGKDYKKIRNMESKHVQASKDQQIQETSRSVLAI